MDTGCLHRDLAELALEAGTRNEFRQLALERICRAVSMDAAAVSQVTPSGITVESIGLSAARLRPALVDYLNEISPSEFAEGLKGRAICDSHVLTARRRAELRLYSDYLVPGGVFSFCIRMWINHRGCSWITLARAGRAAEYDSQDLLSLDRLIPLMMIGEALHERPAPSLNAGERQAWATERGLTLAESRVVDLVQRGLTNAEVAAVLGRSVHTVRNQLACVFRKLRVSTRTELLFILSRAESCTSGDLPPSLRTLARAVRFTSRGSSGLGAPLATVDDLGAEDASSRRVVVATRRRLEE